MWFSSRNKSLECCETMSQSTAGAAEENCTCSEFLWKMQEFLWDQKFLEGMTDGKHKQQPKTCQTPTEQQQATPGNAHKHTLRGSIWAFLLTTAILDTFTRWSASEWQPGGFWYLWSTFVLSPVLRWSVSGLVGGRTRDPERLGDDITITARPTFGFLLLTSGLFFLTPWCQKHGVQTDTGRHCLGLQERPEDSSESSESSVPQQDSTGMLQIPKNSKIIVWSL